MRLGIQIERIKPGCPQQNGRHERMHLTLKQEATRPPRANLIAQQETFDKFQEVFNKERPHQGIDINIHLRYMFHRQGSLKNLNLCFIRSMTKQSQ